MSPNGPTLTHEEGPSTMDSSSPAGGDNIASSLSNTQLNQLYSLIDSLAKLGVHSLLQIPEVLAVGNQTSGKSSTLSSLTGLNFPRDTGLCTRFPTEVRLRRTSGSPSTRAWVRKADTNEEISVEVNRDNIGATIKKAVEYLCPANETISEGVLIIEDNHPNHIPLTVTDLPGYIQYDENDPLLPEKIRKLVLKHISKPYAVILAISPATEDIMNNMVFREAKEVNPGFSRTMGVLTKIDMAPEELRPAVLEVASNKKVNLKNGWHLVINNPRPDRTDGKTHDQFEAEILSKFEWGMVNDRTKTVPRLRERISQHVGAMVRAMLPSLQAKAKDMFEQFRRKRRAIPDGLNTDEKRKAFFNETVLKLKKEYEDQLLQGSAVVENSLVEQINKLKDWIRACLEKATVYLEDDDVTLDGLISDIKRFRTNQVEGLYVYQVFEARVRKQIRDWSGTVYDVTPKIHDLHEEAMHRVMGSGDLGLDHTPMLKARIGQIVQETIDQQCEALEKNIRHHMTLEDQPETSNHKFMQTVVKGHANAQMTALQKVSGFLGMENSGNFVDQLANAMAQVSNQELLARQIVTERNEYIRLAHARLVDVISMNLTYYAIRDFLEQLPKKLLQVTDNEIESLVAEDPDVKREREDLDSKLARMREAVKELNGHAMSGGKAPV